MSPFLPFEPSRGTSVQVSSGMTSSSEFYKKEICSILPKATRCSISRQQPKVPADVFNEPGSCFLVATSAFFTRTISPFTGLQVRGPRSPVIFYFQGLLFLKLFHPEFRVVLM